MVRNNNTSHNPTMSNARLCRVIESIAECRDTDGHDEIRRCVEEGASLDGDGIYHVPLISAIRLKRPDLVRLLIDLGADPLGGLDDLIGVAISKSIKCLWVLLEHIRDERTRIRAMKAIMGADYNFMAWNHRVSRRETLIEFVRRGFLDVEAYCGNPPRYYPVWGIIPRLVQEIIISRQTKRRWSTTAVLGPMSSLALFGASERFFFDALERTTRPVPRSKYPFLLKLRPVVYRRWFDKTHMGWKASRHDWFTPQFRRMVQTIMMCWYRIRMTPESEHVVVPSMPLEMWWEVLFWCARF